MGIRAIRFVSWNLKHGQARPELLLAQRPDIVALQEVRHDWFESLAGHFAGGRFSLDLWATTARPCDHAPNRHGTAVLWSDTFRERRSYLLDHLVAPWKLMLVDLAFTRNLGYFTAGSYHALNGRCGPDGFDKPRLSLQVADWLEHQPGPVVVGMDANSPWVDHPDHDRTECCFNWLGAGDFEPRLLGSAPRHRLRDALRTFLHDHPERLAAITADRPEGPLAVSHRLPGGAAKRYDHVMATPDFDVVNVEYLYEEAVQHGSDHAMVVADFKVRVAAESRTEADALLPTRLFNPPDGPPTGHVVAA